MHEKLQCSFVMYSYQLAAHIEAYARALIYETPIFRLLITTKWPMVNMMVQAHTPHLRKNKPPTAKKTTASPVRTRIKRLVENSIADEEAAHPRAKERPSEAQQIIE